MKIEAATPEEYISKLSEDRAMSVSRLRNLIEEIKYKNRI